MNIIHCKNLFSFKQYSTKLALVVRGDIKMTKGKIAAQCAHAAVLCYQEADKCETKKSLLKNWCTAGQPKIVLKINNYQELSDLQIKCQEVGIMTALVRDAGHTQLDPGTVTVLGIGPASSEEIDNLVSHLRLL